MQLILLQKYLIASLGNLRFQVTRSCCRPFHAIHDSDPRHQRAHGGSASLTTQKLTKKPISQLLQFYGNIYQLTDPVRR
jgi:hypothetical protein